MLRIVFVTLRVLLLAFLSSSAFAGITPPAPVFSHAKSDETTATIGIRFDFGDMHAEIVGAVRHTETDIGNDVIGATGEVAVPLFGEKQFIPTVRAMGIIGTPEIEGLAGAGFDFAANQPLVSAGVQVPYFEGGIDLELTGKLHPYVGANSYNGADERKVVTP